MTFGLFPVGGELPPSRNLHMLREDISIIEVGFVASLSWRDLEARVTWNWSKGGEAGICFPTTQPCEECRLRNVDAKGVNDELSVGSTAANGSDRRK